MTVIEIDEGSALSRKRYSYMNKLDLHDWDGHQPLIVFDGVCVLCSFFARWVLKRDESKHFVFTTAQSDLGQALFDHYDLQTEEFETNLVIIDGQLYEKMYGALAIFYHVGFPWRLLSILKFLPSGLLDFLYESIARNRYTLFGKQEHCLVPTQELKERLVGWDG